MKDNVLKRLYELDKPFAMLFPLSTLQGIKRFKYLKDGIQILAFDKRIGFHDVNNMHDCLKSNFFASVYFCKGILPKDLILEELYIYQKPLLKEVNDGK